MALLIRFTSFLTFSLLCTVSFSLPFPPKRFLTKRYKTINNKRMAYVEVGVGDPIVFLHGNPTSSFLWRNVMPHLEGKGRLIAPDLIGMGDSDKLDPTQPDRYTYLQHANFLFPLLEQLGVKQRVTLVIHDWGSALGFLWAYHHRFDPGAIKGIAFMEAFVAPLENVNPQFQTFFDLFRGPAGEDLVLNKNILVNQLPASIMRNLTVREFEEYKRPYLRPGEDRRPMLTWTRQVPIDGVPADVAKIINDYSEWMATAPFPKLFINANPGALITGESRKLVRSWTEVTEVTVQGIHFIQEDSDDEIGSAIKDWLPAE